MLVALRPPVRFNRPPPPKPDQKYAFLERRFTPRTVFMEIGGADCKLALRAASCVERVYAVDVSRQFLHHVLMPCNLRLVVCDGVHLPVPDAAVDIAWSGVFMDQLTAHDAREHLESVLRCLAPGGEYLCRTGAAPRALRLRFLEAGFSAVRCYAAGVRVPWAMAELLPPGRLRFAASK